MEGRDNGVTPPHAGRKTLPSAWIPHIHGDKDIAERRRKGQRHIAIPTYVGENASADKHDLRVVLPSPHTWGEKDTVCDSVVKEQAHFLPEEKSFSQSSASCYSIREPKKKKKHFEAKKLQLWVVQPVLTGYYAASRECQGRPRTVFAVRAKQQGSKTAQSKLTTTLQHQRVFTTLDGFQL